MFVRCYLRCVIMHHAFVVLPVLLMYWYSRSSDDSSWFPLTADSRQEKLLQSGDLSTV